MNNKKKNIIEVILGILIISLTSIIFLTNYVHFYNSNLSLILDVIDFILLVILLYMIKKDTDKENEKDEELKEKEK